MALFKVDPTGQRAEEALREGAEKHPGSLEVLLYHGDVLGQRGDLLGAMERFKKAAEVDPNCPLPYVNAARAFLSVRDYAQAHTHLKEALSLDPCCGATLLDLGQLYLQTGESAKAEAALQQALAQVGKERKEKRRKGEDSPTQSPTHPITHPCTQSTHPPTHTPIHIKTRKKARYLPEILDALVFQHLARLQQEHQPVGEKKEKEEEEEEE